MAAPSPPELGGDALALARAGVVCSKSARSALLIDGRGAHRFIRGATRSSERWLRALNRPPRCYAAAPPNSGGEFLKTTPSITHIGSKPRLPCFPGLTTSLIWTAV